MSAAVLVPITDHGPAPLVHQEPMGCRRHRGRYRCRAGSCEQRDASRVETALREAWEEIRLPQNAVEVLGLLDDTETRATPFIITPVVGIVTDHVDLSPRRTGDRTGSRGSARSPARACHLSRRDVGAERGGARRVLLSRVGGGRHLGSDRPHRAPVPRPALGSSVGLCATVLARAGGRLGSRVGPSGSVGVREARSLVRAVPAVARATLSRVREDVEHP